ncbi:MAG: alpha/beta fold hydrolase [Sulfitobacter sp.]
MPTQNTGPIAWREVGRPDRPAVIFLHAMAGSATAWGPQMAAYAEDYRCIAWDMPGFGGSDDAPETADMDWTVATLRHFVIQTLGLKSAHFVGLSVGGMILQQFAAKHPGLVTSAAILDSSPKFGYGGDADPDAFVSGILADLESGISAAEFSNGMIRAIVGPDCPENIKLAAIAAMSRGRINGLALTTRLIAQHDAVDVLPNITCPTLAMAGAQDGETPPAYAHAIAQLIPGAGTTIIPNAGHIVNLENPESVTARLRFFLEHAL